MSSAGNTKLLLMQLEIINKTHLPKSWPDLEARNIGRKRLKRKLFLRKRQLPKILIEKKEILTVSNFQ